MGKSHQERQCLPQEQDDEEERESKIRRELSRIRRCVMQFTNMRATAKQKNCSCDE